MATIPEAAVIEAAAAISEQLTDGLSAGDRARRWQEQAVTYQRAARAGLAAALPHMQHRGMTGIHERLLYGLRLGSLNSYMLALAIACVMIFVRLMLGSLVEDVPYLAYVPAVLLAGFYCGVRPGLVAAGLCGLFSWLYFIPLAWSWDLERLAEGRGLIAYLIVGSFCAIMMGALRCAVDRQREAEMRQAMLIGELQHRTRNLLSIVRTVSERTASTSESLDEFRREYADRLDAIGRVQKLLWQDRKIDLHSFIREELFAQGAEEADGRICIEGPPVQLPARSMHVLARAIHELATNSLKYGALSQPDASLNVAWRLGPKAGLSLAWEEHGVRMPPDPCSGEGFGRQLIERALPYNLRAETHFDLTADGVRCRIELPVKNLA